MKSVFNKLNKYIIPIKYKKFYKIYKNREFNLLDVGCGQYPVIKAKIVFPKCNYYGLDLTKYETEGHGYDLMKKLYLADLEKDDLSSVPDDFFDVVMCTHVIEHIPNGIEVIERLTKKVKPGGYLYLEWPAVRTLSLPSIPAIFNFCDDDTHIRIYSIVEVANTVLAHNYRVIRAGKRRDIMRIILLPAFYILDRFYYKHGYAGAFYDLVGWAEYVFAQRRVKEVENYYRKTKAGNDPL